MKLEQAGEESGQKRPEMGQDFADVVSAAAQDGEDRVTERAREAAAGAGEAVGVLQTHQACDQARRESGPPLRGGEETGPVFFEPGPVDQRRQPDQFVARVDHVEQAWARRVGVFGRAGAVPHGRETRRVCRRGQPNRAIPQRPIRGIAEPDQCIGSCSRPTK